MRWEYYVQVFLITLSGVIVNSSFRVLFSEMMPPRNEVRWFGLQYVLSCATVSETLFFSNVEEHPTPNLEIV